MAIGPGVKEDRRREERERDLVGGRAAKKAADRTSRSRDERSVRAASTSKVFFTRRVCQVRDGDQHD
jgi:hypothetical protein